MTFLNATADNPFGYAASKSILKKYRYDLQYNRYSQYLIMHLIYIPFQLQNFARSAKTQVKNTLQSQPNSR